MRNDINLLQKRKNQKFSSKKWAAILLCIALFAGAVYAGFTLPATARVAAQSDVTRLQNELTAISGTNEDISSLSSDYALRKQQIDALTAIDAAKSDISEYIDAIEASLPSTANISYLSASKESIGITGVADGDDVIAAFCLHLRQSEKFSQVFLSSSSLMEDGTTTFTLELTLPVTLDNSGVLPEAEASPSSEPEPTAEVSQ